jgi:small subunit ribosomal protein S6
MKRYEIVVLLHPDLEIDLEKPQKKIEKIIKDVGGKIQVTDNWGKRRLAYPITGLDYAVYIYYEVEIDNDKVAEIDATFNITNEILRHMITVHIDRSAEDAEAEERARKAKAYSEKNKDKEEA